MSMELRTIEVEIDRNGHIRCLEPFVHLPVGRALLTVLSDSKAQLTSSSNVEETQAGIENLFGILTAQHGVSLENMKQVILHRSQEQFHDCD